MSGEIVRASLEHSIQTGRIPAREIQHWIRAGIITPYEGDALTTHVRRQGGLRLRLRRPPQDTVVPRERS